jgi:hypothetical protein
MLLFFALFSAGLGYVLFEHRADIISNMQANRPTVSSPEAPPNANYQDNQPSEPVAGGKGIAISRLTSRAVKVVNYGDGNVTIKYANVNDQCRGNGGELKVAGIELSIGASKPFPIILKRNEAVAVVSDCHDRLTYLKLWMEEGVRSFYVN